MLFYWADIKSVMILVFVDLFIFLQLSVAHRFNVFTKKLYFCCFLLIVAAVSFTGQTVPGEDNLNFIKTVD